MAAEWICDGCGKREPAMVAGIPKKFMKPRDWYERSDDDGVQTACSRECIDAIAEKTGKTRVILPI